MRESIIETLDEVGRWNGREATQRKDSEERLASQSSIPEMVEALSATV